MRPPNERPPNERRRCDPRPAAEGWKPLFPGVYEDRDGALHFAVPELLALFGWADNAENRDLVEQEVRRVVAELFPGSPVEVRE